MKRVFFTLASARSGTLYLRDIFRQNISDCASRHEPFFDWGNPTLFGPAVYDAHAGRLDAIRARLARKRDYIERLRQPVYLESSHVFLKSAYVAALEIFPDLRLIHLVRDWRLVAKSEAWREQWRRRVHAPFHFYRGADGRRHFCWALTGNEEIFQAFDQKHLTLFQWYLIQWIEIENRAMRFLDTHQLHDRCFTLHSPRDLNDADKLREMFDFFELPISQPLIRVRGRRNKSIGHQTEITEEDERQADEVLRKLPSPHLEIFRRKPYGDYAWHSRLCAHALPAQQQPCELNVQ